MLSAACDKVLLTLRECGKPAFSPLAQQKLHGKNSIVIVQVQEVPDMIPVSACSMISQQVGGGYWV
jgi:hypothetical protein